MRRGAMCASSAAAAANGLRSAGDVTASVERRRRICSSRLAPPLSSCARSGSAVRPGTGQPSPHACGYHKWGLCLP